MITPDSGIRPIDPAPPPPEADPLPPGEVRLPEPKPNPRTDSPDIPNLPKGEDAVVRDPTHRFREVEVVPKRLGLRERRLTARRSRTARVPLPRVSRRTLNRVAEPAGRQGAFVHRFRSP